MESSLIITAARVASGSRIPDTKTQPHTQIYWADAKTTRVGTTDGGGQLIYKVQSVIICV